MGSAWQIGSTPERYLAISSRLDQFNTLVYLLNTVLRFETERVVRMASRPSGRRCLRLLPYGSDLSARSPHASPVTRRKSADSVRKGVAGRDPGASGGGR